jgi:hypothetical protein
VAQYTTSEDSFALVLVGTHASTLSILSKRSLYARLNGMLMGMKWLRNSDWLLLLPMTDTMNQCHHSNTLGWD